MPTRKKSAKAIQENIAARSQSRTRSQAKPAVVAQTKEKTKAVAPKKSIKIEVSPVRGTRSKNPAPLKRKGAMSKSVDEAKLSSDNETSSDQEIVYKAGDLVAFVDKDDAEAGKQIISIGKVIEDSYGENEAVKVQWFVPSKPTDKHPVEFTLNSNQSELTINFYQIVSIAEPSAKKVKSTIIQINKATILRVVQLLDNAFDGIREKVNAEIEAKDDSGASSSIDNDDVSDSEEEVKAVSKKSQPKTTAIVRAKRPATQTQRTAVVAPVIINIRSASRKAAAKIKEETDSADQKEHSDAEAESDEDGAKSRKKVQIGKKRSAPFQAPASQVVSRQVKKLSDGTEEQTVKVVAKPKKPAKKPTEFKAGKWNPETVLLTKEHEVEHYGPGDSAIFNCCLRCNNRNIIRAVENDNVRLFRSLVYDQENIPCLTDSWSAETEHLDPLRMILNKKNIEMLEVIFKIPQRNAADMNLRNQKLQEFYMSDRVKVKPYLLNRVNTGNVNYKAYGTAVRKVEQTRGNRQGNQAFYRNHINVHVPTLQDTPQELKLLTPDFIKAYQLLTGNNKEYVHQIASLARVGNRDFLIWLMEPLIKQENYGFNELHLDVLKLEKLTKKYHTASITKKANSASMITPLHLACINPNKNVLSALLEQNNDINVMDQQNYKPIHYAAACSDPGPMQVLLEKSANLFDFTNQKETALHIAAMNGNAKLIKLILETNVALFKFRDKKNKTAMIYACELGDIETIKAFLDFSQGKIKVNSGQGIQRMTPLMYAASQGNYELAEFLLERKARVLSKDKFKRTALIMAVRNGHTRLASLLLQNGSEWNHEDSSHNTPLHYAAGSGFIECIDLLIQHGADVNAQNSWKVTPITIAMLNNHLGTVKRLLQEPTVDVNGKDDQGRTLLMMNMIDLSEPSCVNFAKYLLDKGADANIADVDGNTPLHRLAAYKVRVQVEKFKKAETEERKSLLNMIDLLIIRGAKLDILNLNNKNAFTIALDSDNIDVLHKFAQSVRISQDPQLLHKFKSKIFDDRYQTILLELLNKEVQTQASINVLNQQGFTPYLAYVNQYVTDLKDYVFSTKIREALQWNAHKHKLNYHLYQMNNTNIFAPKFQEEENYRNQQSRDIQSIPEDKMQQLIKKYKLILITVPFIAFLKILIDKGADPHAKVDKIEFYRELDEHKKTIALVGEARQGVLVGQVFNEQMQIDTTQNKNQVEIKTRKEVLAEQRVDKKDGKKLTKTEKAEKRISKVLKDFYAKKCHQAVFERQNGKLVEIEYNKEFGLQNAVHLIMRNCSKTFFDFLVDELKTPVDKVDYLGRNPFMLNAIANPNKTEVTASVQRLLDMNVKFDLSDSKGRTPFLIYYEHNNFVLANKLLDQGANINQMDDQGLFALKFALIKRNNEEIQRLVSIGANINQTDTKGRNLLHHAINMSSATADATFETEQLLIDLGVNINFRDNKLRVPLHYAFIKIKDWQTSQPIDPIETISSLCAQATLEIDVADKWNKTPLHYAAQRGASICTLYILNRGSNLEAKDIYGNTALGISLLRKHFNYGIILIQKKADVKVPIYDEYPNRIAKKLSDEENAEKKKHKIIQKALVSGQINAEMESQSDDQSDESGQDNNNRTGRDLFRQKVTKRNVFFNNGYGSEDDSSEDESDNESSDNHEQQVFNQQNAFGMTVFQGRKKPMTRMNASGYTFNNNNPQNQTNDKSKDVEPVLPPKSTFRLAIQNQQQGIAYLIIDNGYDYMLATQDALDDQKFYLVLTLFSKISDDRILQQKNEKYQNLMHILAKNSTGGKFHILKRIYDILKKRGVNCLERDSFGSNPLHYAVQQNCFDLCQILIQEGVGINEINNAGHTPLSLHMKGHVGASRILRSLQDGIAMETFNRTSIFLLLARNGADMNVEYPEESFECDKDYKCSIIINIVRHAAIDMEQMRSNLQCIIEFGAKLSAVDTLGKDVLMYAIMHNDLELVRFLLNNKEKGLIQNHTDNEQKNAIHYVVKSAKFGSFENVAIFNILTSILGFFDLNQRDKDKQSPLDYALLQESGVMADALQTKMGASSKKQGRVAISYHPESEWPVRQYDFDADSRQLLDQAEAKKAQEMMDLSKDAYIPLDVVLSGEKQYQVYFDAERRPYDAYLQKVDLKNGLYGDYVFYKLQLVHDTNRDLYIVLTRWGRIGEEGMNQRSPFNLVEDAKKEFQTIFKQKSGNEWSTAETSFEKQPKKYSLVKVHYSNVKHQDYLAPFDYDNCAKTQMNKFKRLLIEEIANVTMYQRAVSSQGIDKDQMPISNLKKETLQEAKLILNDLRAMIVQLDAERAKYMQASHELVQELRVKISDQSSKYFELIPLAENKDQITRAIDNQHMLSLNYTKLELLTSVEFSSRVLLGALYRQMQVNPVDYVHDCLQTHIIPIVKGDPEYDLIAQYISNTCSSDLSKFKQFNLFKLERRGEGERFQSFKQLKNRRLLFHGSAMTNMLGILSQGLRIAPPEAPTTGYMFGKGVYFADTFDKSAAYTTGHQSRLMLMCEVALGEMMELYQSFYVENLPTKFNSVKGCGAKGPDYEKKTLVTPQGFQVPVSKLIDYSEPSEDKVSKTNLTAGIPANQIVTNRNMNAFGGGMFAPRFGQQQQQQQYKFNWQLQRNEYIVYNVDQIKIRYMIQFEI